MSACEGTHQLRIIVQHLLEVWHPPLAIDAVAVEAATDPVVDATILQRRKHRHRHRHMGFIGRTKEEMKQLRRREFR